MVISVLLIHLQHTDMLHFIVWPIFAYVIIEKYMPSIASYLSSVSQFVLFLSVFQIIINIEIGKLVLVLLCFNIFICQFIINYIIPSLKTYAYSFTATIDNFYFSIDKCAKGWIQQKCQSSIDHIHKTELINWHWFFAIWTDFTIFSIRVWLKITFKASNCSQISLQCYFFEKNGKKSISYFFFYYYRIRKASSVKWYSI